MSRAASPHSELFTSICFQEFHPSGGWSLKGRSATMTLGGQSLSCPAYPLPGFSMYIFPSLLQEAVCQADPCAGLSPSFLQLISAAAWAKLPCAGAALVTCSRACPLQSPFSYSSRTSDSYSLPQILRRVASASAASWSWRHPRSSRSESAPGSRGAGQNHHGRPQAYHVPLFVMCGSRLQMCWSWSSSPEETALWTHWVFAHCDFLKNQTAIPVKHSICQPNSWLLVPIISSSLHRDGWRESSPVVNSPRDGGYQRVQLTLWQIILKSGIVHSLGSYYEYWQSWKQSTNCQTMVAEGTAWVCNMITVLVLLTPCLALSNSSLVFDNWLRFDGAMTMGCYAEKFFQNKTKL